MEQGTLLSLGIALGLGLLVGMQREWASSQLAGVRTFPLITLLGTLCALLAEHAGGWTIAAGLIVAAAMIVLGNITKFQQGNLDPGLTTEFAVLVMFAVGAMVPSGHTAAALAVTGAVAVLLHWKRPLHDLVDKIGESEFRAIMQFVLISLVILPVLPNRTYGPFHVLNPFQIWLMVVLIVGISLVAYVIFRVLGPRLGVLAASVLGGIISSTATTVSYARRSADQPQAARGAAIVIILASTASFSRVILEILLIAPDSFGSMATPLATMMGFMVLVCVVALLTAPLEAGGAPRQEDPAELKTAILFGLLYAVVIFAVAGSREWFGETGLWVTSALSGLTDMDAITLSTAQLVNADRLDPALGWRLILVASLANFLFKFGVVFVFGQRSLIIRIAVLFGFALAGGTALLVFWPAGA